MVGLSQIQELKRLRDLDNTRAAAGDTLLAVKPALNAERAEIVHRGVECEPGGNIGRAAD